MIRVLVAAVLATGVLGAAVVSGQQPIFRGAGDIVRIFATVTDGQGRLVPRLAQESFAVRDEGKPQPITLFDNTPQPIRLIVLLDVSSSMEGNLPLLRAASTQLLSRLGPDDLARVGTFGHDVVISPVFTRDARALQEALPKTIAADAPTPLWRALDEGLNAFAQSRDEWKDRGRPVILVLSDGRDSGPIGFSRSFVSQAQVIDRAREEDVMIYGIGMRSRSRRPMPPGLGAGGLQAMIAADLPDPGLALVAEQTGGGYVEIRPNDDLAAAFADIADELHSQYLLGFAPPQRDGKVHDVEVRLTERGMKARARKSYVAPKS